TNASGSWTRWRAPAGTARGRRHCWASAARPSIAGSPTTGSRSEAANAVGLRRTPAMQGGYEDERDLEAPSCESDCHALPGRAPRDNCVGLMGPCSEPRAATDPVLHHVVRRHLDRFLAATAAATDGAGLPRFIAREFRDFMGCGQLERGFAGSGVGSNASSP